MKTAIQQAIERLKIAHPKKITNDWNEGYMQALETAAGIIRDLLPAEECHIEDAWDMATKVAEAKRKLGAVLPMTDREYEIVNDTFSDYYSKTYNNE